MTLQRSSITPAGTTAPLGAYSPAIAITIGEARLVFVSGLLPLDANGNLVGDDIEAQTRCVFDGLRSVLEASGGRLEHTVKVQIFLTDIGEYGTVSTIRNEYLGTARPASTLVEVSALAKPGCRIEIDAVAAIENGQ